MFLCRCFCRLDSRSRVAGTEDKCFSSSVRCCRIYLHKDCTVLYYHQQRTRVPFPQSMLSHLGFLPFWQVNNSISMQLQFVFSLLVRMNIFHIFNIICIYFFVNRLCPLSRFPIGLLIFFPFLFLETVQLFVIWLQILFLVRHLSLFVVCCAKHTVVCFKKFFYVV